LALIHHLAAYHHATATEHADRTARDMALAAPGLPTPLATLRAMAAPMRRSDPPPLPPEPPVGHVSGPPQRWGPVPTPVEAPERPPRAWAAIVVAWIGLAVATVAAFEPWASYVDGVRLTGVEHGDGWIVLVIAAVGAAFAGALVAGWRHFAVRLGLIGTSIALFLVFLADRIDIGNSVDHVNNRPIDVGGGLYGVAAAACLVLAGALIIPPRDRRPKPARA
jgi:hypothetical protein